MTVELTIFAINSLVRLGQTGIKAYENSVQNEDILFPNLKKIRLNSPASIDYYFKQDDNLKFVEGDDAPYAEFWYSEGFASRPKWDNRSIDTLTVLATKIEAQNGRTFMSENAGPAATLVKTWTEGNEPLSPIARIALVGADIALEYVGNNTGTIGGGNGAKLISAYATSLSKQLPNNGDLSSKDKVSLTLTGILLRAGFETIATHADWIASEDHLIALIESTVAPLTEAFPLDTDIQVIEFDMLQKTLMGPAAGALLKTLADHQTAFLGQDFTPDKALGAITKALFLNAKHIGIQDQFTKQGLLSLYKVSLEVVATQPELFFDNDGSVREQLANDLFSSMAGVLSKAGYPFNSQIGVDLAKVSLSAMSKNLAKFDDNDKPWEQTAAALLTNMIDTLIPVVGKQGALKNVFTEAQLTEYGRIILTQIGKSPSMIIHASVNGENKVYSGLIKAMTRAMAADSKLLLSGDDWLKIAAVAAQEAATNPMRLFNLDPANPEHVLAGDLMSLMLNSASEFADLQGNKSVLFGQVLADAIAIMLSATSGKVSAVLLKMDDMKTMMTQLNTFMADGVNEYGSKEFLIIFRGLLQKVLIDIEVPQLTQELVVGLLTGSNK